jgi:hypothetical protein
LTKNESSRLALERTQADAVFYADSESAFRSIEIVIHLKEIAIESSKKGKNHPPPRWSPEYPEWPTFGSPATGWVL